MVNMQSNVYRERLETPMKHTLGTAAKAVGMSKATISKAIKSGKISAVRLPNGSFEIEPVELHKVYPPTSETVSDERSETPEETTRNSNNSLLLQAKLEMAMARIADLENDRDQWRQTANRLLDNRDANQGSSKTLFGRLFSR
jgi:hypothetical protein